MPAGVTLSTRRGTPRMRACTRTRIRTCAASPSPRHPPPTPPVRYCDFLAITNRCEVALGKWTWPACTRSEPRSRLASGCTPAPCPRSSSVCTSWAGSRCSRLVVPAPLQHRNQDLRRRHRADRVHARRAARVRRRPHRAIDNTTRKLMAEGKRPLSRRVLVLARPLHYRVRAVAAALARRQARWRARCATDLGPAPRTTVVGTSVSGTFLYLIAAINLVMLAGIVKVFRGMRHGRYDEAGAGGASQRTGA